MGFSCWNRMVYFLLTHLIQAIFLVKRLLWMDGSNRLEDGCTSNQRLLAVPLLCFDLKVKTEDSFGTDGNWNLPLESYRARSITEVYRSWHLEDGCFYANGKVEAERRISPSEPIFIFFLTDSAAWYQKVCFYTSKLFTNSTAWAFIPIKVHQSEASLGALHELLCQ